ncbi:MAG: apolipoprotein N-acyltransferase, partial [Actinomycetota bacterium]|nr:apolipoprotein N-acyltransferase [Actinomycetota bacterium]
GALGCALAGLLVPLLPPLGSSAVGAREVVVAVIQGNVPRAGLDFNAQREQVLRNHVARTHELAARVRAGDLPRPELVIWPENGSDLDPFTDSSAYVLIDDAVRDIGVPVLVGAVLDGPGREVSNAGIVWDPVTGPGERYLKRHPVPFAEYIPLRPLARRVSSAVELRQRDTSAGSEPGVLAMAGATVGDVICFEVAYDGLVRDVVAGGAGLLAVQTNNATFGFTPETEQQLVMSQLRAVEHGRSTVVAATSGVSAIISARGRVLRRAELFTPAVLVERVPLAGARTLATRAGVLVEALLAAGAALALAARRPGRSPRGAPGGPTR